MRILSAELCLLSPELCAGTLLSPELCAVRDLASLGLLPADRYAAYLEIHDAVEAVEAQNRYRGKKG